VLIVEYSEKEDTAYFALMIVQKNLYRTGEKKRKENV
jgi:hypothetical protein